LSEEVRGQDARNAAAEWRLFPTGGEFSVGCFGITAFSVPHDASDPVGFTIRTGDASIGILTDLGHVNQSVVHHVAGVGCLFVEANHDEELLRADAKRPFSIKQRIMSPHGHLSNRAAADLAARACTPQLRHVVLGHLSRDCNSAELAVSAVSAALSRWQSVEVICSRPDEPLAPVRLGR
jgi:phosphoribosyl 1,2-cyclic phosphodiesterase